MFVLIFLIGIVIRLLVAIFTTGTWDMESVYLVADLLKKGLPVYMETWRYNQPPTWMYTIQLFSYIADLTHLPLYFWARVPLVISDVVLAWLLLKICRIKGWSINVQRYILVLFLLSPIVIFISAYDGQLDSSICLFILLAAYPFIKNEKVTFQKMIWSAVFLGVGATIKLVPLMVVPVFVIYFWKKLRQDNNSFFRILFNLAIFIIVVLLPLLLIFIPFINQWEGIKKDVFGYQTGWGIWGISLFIRRTADSQNFPEFVYLLRDWSKNQLVNELGVLFFSYLIIFWKKFKLVDSIFFLFLTMTVFSTSFAMQYLFWVVPFWLIWRDNLREYSLYNIFVFAVYLMMFGFWQKQEVFTYWATLFHLTDVEFFYRIYIFPVFFAWLSVFIAWRKMFLSKR